MFFPSNRSNEATDGARSRRDAATKSHIWRASPTSLSSWELSGIIGDSGSQSPPSPRLDRTHATDVHTASHHQARHPHRAERHLPLLYHPIPQTLILNLLPPKDHARQDTEDSTASASSSLSKAKTIIAAAPKLAKTVLINAPNTAVDQAKKARDHLHDVKDAADALDEEAAQPPEIVYGKDVALDMAGYHNAEVAGEEDSDDAGKTTPGRPFPSSSSSPPSTSHLPLPEGSSTHHSYVRGGSAPPDVQVTIPSAGDLSTSPPDYTWEWGAFPTRSPARPTLKPLVRDDAGMMHAGPSHLGQAVTTAEEVAAKSEEEGDASTSSFGQGGHLFPDDMERDLFWVNMEGKKFSFQLSLCDNDEGHRRRFDDLESARWFEDEKVEYARLLADPDVAANEQLVM
ncbi:hypothetical protein FRC01_009244, partial [Tulasnella sp. 417]